MLLLLRRHSVSTKSKLNRSLIFQFSARFTSVLSIVIGFPFFSKVPRSDAANDLALLKADGRFAPLPIAASRAVTLGGTVATGGFPDIGLQGFAPKLAKGEIASLSGAADDPRYFQISVPLHLAGVPAKSHKISSVFRLTTVSIMLR